MDPDLPLIEALRDNDDSALSELMSRHREALYHFAYRYLRDETAAHDVVQETFVRVFFKADRFQPRALVKTWIFSIALNLCRDQQRRRAKHYYDISLDAPKINAAPPPEPIDPSARPDDRAEEREQVSLLRQAIDHLPRALREPLILFSLEQHTQKETAAILNTTPKSVELRVYRAKARLRSWLGKAPD